MIYRVTYPLFATDASRDFATRREADDFAAAKRDNPGRFQTPNAWRLVRVEEIASAVADD